MRTHRLHGSTLPALLCLLALPSGARFAGENPSALRGGTFADIRAVDFARLFTDESAHREEAAEVQTRYADLTGDGREEAVVNGWNSDGGNGGPNIASIFTLDGA